MNAPVAETLKVIGSSSAMVSAGPMPGRTPIAVPRKQPSSAQPRLASVSAPANPVASPCQASMAASGAPPPGADERDGAAELAPPGSGGPGEHLHGAAISWDEGHGVLPVGALAGADRGGRRTVRDRRPAAVHV